MATEQDRWQGFEDALTYMYEHPAEPMERNETRGLAYFEGYRDAISQVHFQFKLASRAAGHPESDNPMGAGIGQLRQALIDLIVEVRETIRCSREDSVGMTYAMLTEVERVMVEIAMPALAGDEPEMRAATTQ